MYKTNHYYYSKKILVIFVWICLLTLCQSKVIEVNNRGNDNTDCCIKGKCPCDSLFNALHYIKDDTVINITSSLVMLPFVTKMGSGTLRNIMITGDGAIVACNNSGIIICVGCSNVVIKGITWDQCGNPNHPYYQHAIGFRDVVNISIITCTFQFSKVCNSVVLGFSSGFIHILDTRFLFNYVINSSQCEIYGSLTIIESYTKEDVDVIIIGALFDYNGALDYREEYVNFRSSALYFESFSYNTIRFTIINSTISNSMGLGSYLWCSNILTAMQLINITLFNNSDGGIIVTIMGSRLLSKAYIWINSSTFTHNSNGSFKLNMLTETGVVSLYELTIADNRGTFRKDILNNTIDQGTAILMQIYNFFTTLKMSSCNIHNNVGKSIVYIHVSSSFNKLVNASIASCNFTNNQGSVLHLSGLRVELKSYILFMNNSAEKGAAMYFDQNTQVTINDGSFIEFIRNTASQGGAIFIELPSNCPQPEILLISSSTVIFINNYARLAGNSIYFDIPESCDIIRDPTNNNSIVYIPDKFNYTQLPGSLGPPIITSPYEIALCSKVCHLSKSTSNSCNLSRRIMLGQSTEINATICDYYGNISITVQFSIHCINCNNKYRLFSNKILVHNGPFSVTILAVDADNDIIDDKNITLTLSAVLPNKYRQLTGTVSLKLSPCQSGYVFDTNVQKCECYKQSKDVIRCQQDIAEIKYGYWFGIAVFPKRTVSICPVHFCEYNKHEETVNGYFKLPQELDDQCSSHRTGIACGNCKSGYTLAYDSPDCINTDKCSIGMTVLVVALTSLYWIIVVVLVFGLMQFKVSLGYAYGLIYYYSIIDILLGINLFISNGTYQLVTILSSFAKLTPQFLGKLCFVQGISGIDQQFIHYLHALSIFVLLGVMVIVARCSFKIASIVRHCIIRVICLLILLSYTSLASTSLQLLRPLYFDDIDDTYIYSSPSIKYFTGRHIPYGIIAMLCELFIVIGLPLLLLLEPFLNGKVNFIKIKPLLDQFQECYKDRYHWFAAYYLVCRQVIITLVYVSNFNNALYYLQMTCIISVLIHTWIQPYKNEKLNALDGVILLIMVLVVNLNLFTFSASSTIAIITVVIASPLLLSCFIYATIFFRKNTTEPQNDGYVNFYNACNSICIYS